MHHSDTAKLFTTGGSQAVRLPSQYRFTGDVVYIRRNELTGEVILSSRPPRPYAEFMATRDSLGPLPDDFLSPVERAQGQERRDPFANPFAGAGE
jgi:antitoxin VapB